MMKKFLSVITVLLAALVLFSFAACGGEQNPDNPGGTVNPGATVTLNKTELTLNEGAEERLTATTDPAGESISFASSDESVITVSVTGLVTAQAAGTATVTVTVESSGNTATCAVTVNAQQLNIPTGADIKRIDENQDFERVVPESVTDLTISRSGDVTKLTYTLDLTNFDLTRSTKMAFNFKGNGEDVFVLVHDKITQTIMSQTFKTTAGWNTYEMTIPKATRHMMKDAQKVCITVPVPDARYEGNGGTVQIGGLWFAGDAEPSVLKEYKYEEYDVVASVDLSKWNEIDWKDTFQGQNKVTNGEAYVEGTYNEEDGSLTIVNHNYSKWLAMPFKIPSGDYSEVECIAIRAKGTPGVALAGQVSYQDAFEMRKFTEEEQWHFADISEYEIDSKKAPYISIAPCKFNTGYTEWELTIYSIELLKPRDPNAPPRVLPEENSDLPADAVRVDVKENFSTNPEMEKGYATITTQSDGSVKVRIGGAALREGMGAHWVSLSLTDYVVNQATHLGVRLKGDGEFVTVKILTKDGEVLLDQHVATASRWQRYLFPIEEEMRAKLNNECIITLLVGDWSEDRKAGSPEEYFGGIYFEGAVAPEPEEPCDHVDADSDGKCDVCGADMPTTEPEEPCDHVDADSDGKCDVCGEDMPTTEPEEPCTEHVDADSDGKCDVCGADMPTTEPEEPCDHVDADSDGKCDVCGADMPTTEPEEPADTGITFAINDVATYRNGFTVKVNGGTTNIEAKGVAVRAQDGTNTVSASLEGIELGGKTKLRLNAGGYWFNSQNNNEKQSKAVSIIVKVMGANGAIAEQTFELTEAGQDFVLTAADFSGATSIQIVIPVYDAEMAATQGMRANVSLSDVHFE